MALHINRENLKRIAASASQAPVAECLPHDPGQNNWCWAACVAMALRIVKGIKEDQCSLATGYFRPVGPDCCQGASCNFGCKLEDSKGQDLRGVFRSRGFGQVDLIQRALSPVELSTQLGNGPVAVGWEGSSATPNHVVLVIDFREQQDLVTICDPVPSRLSGTLSFVELNSSISNGRLRKWKWTWAPLG
jgi:hypothetical protein